MVVGDFFMKTGHIKEGLAMEPAFKTLRDQIEFTVTPEGLRIDLIEKDDATFFDSGSATIRGETGHVFGVIAVELEKLDLLLGLPADHHDATDTPETISAPGLTLTYYSGAEGRLDGDPLTVMNTATFAAPS